MLDCQAPDRFRPQALDGLARSLGYELEAVWERLVEDDEQGESAHTADDPRHP